MTFSFLMSHSSENFGCYLVLCHHTDEIGIILNDSGGQTRKYKTSELVNECRRHELPERVPQAHECWCEPHEFGISCMPN